MDIHAVKKEEELDKKLAEARQEITSQFISIAKHLESQIETQLFEVEAKIYGDVEKKISLARQKEELAIASANKWVKNLLTIRQDFERILRLINKLGNVV
ncbi:hypothetical protein [Floridanema aerugineum]|uniref:Uncharacterized protein n=1 Tax=Floridaenema aerugineum BLCC-F46 TaxID=3153654 RepID=A0ABV4WXP0_9CYAN